MELIDRQAAIDFIDAGHLVNPNEPRWSDNEVVNFLKSRPSAQPEREVYSNMSDKEFEKWLYEHGICHSDINESIPCMAVPLLIDNAINELSSAQTESKTGRWIYGEDDGGQDGWTCSECGFFVPWYYDYYGLNNIDFIRDFHTCPHCDAKMLTYTGKKMEVEHE